jgi:hypothetical protein
VRLFWRRAYDLDRSSPAPRFSIGDAALEHPEAAIGMDELHAAGTELLFGGLDAAGDLVGGFDVVHLDVHDTETDADFRIEVLQGIEIGRRTMRELQHEVVGMQRVQKADQRGPFAFLDGLAAVVAEAEVDGFAAFDGIEHAIDARSGDGRIGGIAGDVGFIDLHAVALQFSGLSGQGIGDGHVQRGEVVVMRIQQRAGEHVGAGERELEGPTSHLRGTGAVFGQDSARPR